MRQCHDNKSDLIKSINYGKDSLEPTVKTSRSLQSSIFGKSNSVGYKFKSMKDLYCFFSSHKQFKV